VVSHCYGKGITIFGRHFWWPIYRSHFLRLKKPCLKFPFFLREGQYWHLHSNFWPRLYFTTSTASGKGRKFDKRGEKPSMNKAVRYWILANVRFEYSDNMSTGRYANDSSYGGPNRLHDLDSARPDLVIWEETLDIIWVCKAGNSRLCERGEDRGKMDGDSVIFWSVFLENLAGGVASNTTTAFWRSTKTKSRSTARVNACSGLWV